MVKDANLIDRWAAKPTVTERRSILIEKKVFLSAYAMRKLFEADKLSSTFDGTNVKTEQFGLLPGQKVRRWKAHHLEEFFDLNNPFSQSVNVRDLLDTIIHNLVFVESVYDDDDHRVSGFFVTSDKRAAHLWLVPINEYTKLMRLVGTDYPTVSTTVFDYEAARYFSWRGHGQPPAHVEAKMKKFLSGRSSTG